MSLAVNTQFGFYSGPYDTPPTPWHCRLKPTATL